MVCGLNGSPGRRLARAFATRNAASISEGLRQIVEDQASLVEDQADDFHRINEQASEYTGDPEDDNPKPEELIDRKRSELMKNYNSLFTNAQKLYKLDSAPAGVTVNVGVAGGTTNIESIRDNPRALASAAQRELEQQHDVVTPEMVLQRVTQLQEAPRADESGHIVEGEVDE